LITFPKKDFFPSPQLETQYRKRRRIMPQTTPHARKSKKYGLKHRRIIPSNPRNPADGANNISQNHRGSPKIPSELLKNPPGLPKNTGTSQNHRGFPKMPETPAHHANKTFPTN
jgi:hypothetical protein